jgi:pyruvate formate lyase activating enzyme
MFLKPLQFELLELLPYHTLGVSKWKSLQLPYKLENIAPPDKKDILHIKQKLQDAGITVKCEY